MICIYCGGTTSVTNSRKQVRTNSTWRRRMCDQCNQVTTSIETTQLSSAVLVEGASKKPSPFNRDKLMVSIYESCKHRSNPAKDAGGLADTVIAALRPDFTQGVITSEQIVQATKTCLKRFDTAASVQYAAFHPTKTR